VKVVNYDLYLQNTLNICDDVLARACLPVFLCTVDEMLNDGLHIAVNMEPSVRHFQIDTFFMIGGVWSLDRHDRKNRFALKEIKHILHTCGDIVFLCMTRLPENKCVP
jgi:hypothetical protein